MAVTQSGAQMAGGGSGSGPPDQSRTGRRRWWWLAPSVVLAAAVVIALAAWAAAYQPLSLGAATSGGLPGLARPQHARQVNNFGGDAGELYIPPQYQVFAVSVSLGNWGSAPVAIEAVSINPPDPGDAPPLVRAGRVLYWTSQMFDGAHPRPGRPIAGLSLRPGQDNDVYVAIPVRTSPCYLRGAYSTISAFYALERFAIFSKWVRIPLPTPLRLQAPGDPASGPGGGAVCPGR
jgi:hypothetical protein